MKEFYCKILWAFCKSSTENPLKALLILNTKLLINDNGTLLYLRLNCIHLLNRNY